MSLVFAFVCCYFSVICAIYVTQLLLVHVTFEHYPTNSKIKANASISQKKEKFRWEHFSAS